MDGSITIEIDGVGPILFKKTKRRARNLNISVKPSQPVCVSVPSGISFDRAKKFVQAKLSWIRKHSDRMKNLEKNHGSRLVDVSHMSYVEKKLRLIRRVVELTRQYGFACNKILIRNQRTRWGSCSARNNISLNIKLAQLPDRLIDYVILHELIHTRIKNHSRDFWAELNRLTGDAKTFHSEVKSYHLGLME